MCFYNRTGHKRCSSVFEIQLTTLSELYCCKGCKMLTKFTSSTCNPSSFVLCYNSMLSTFCFHRYTPFPFSSFLLRRIRFSSSFHYVFSFYLIIIMQQSLNHSTRVRSTPIPIFKHTSKQEYHGSFSVWTYNVLDLLQRMPELLNDDAKELVAVMQHKPQRRKQPAVVLGFRCSDDAVLHELGMHQIRLVLWASMSSRAYASQSSRIKELVAFLFRDRKATVTLVNGSRFLELILAWNGKLKTRLLLWISPAQLSFRSSFYSTAYRSSTTGYMGGL